MSNMETVGVRALKQNASEVLALVKAGEVVEVTERGRPVALLVPIPSPTGSAERLVTEGRARAAEGNLCDLGRPLAPVPNRPLPSAVLAELRAGER